MNYPEELVNLVKKRCEGMQLEGINNGAGDEHAKIMLVGEAPGRKEIVDHVPFCGAAGKELDKSLKLLGLNRDDVYITSAVRSRPYSIKKVFGKKENKWLTKMPNRKPNKKEILAQAPLLDYEIEQVNPKIIVAMGNTALERLLGSGYRISDEHGKILKNTPILKLNRAKDKLVKSDKTYMVVPEYHPAAVFYNRKLEPEINEDWTNLKKIL